VVVGVNDEIGMLAPRGFSEGMVCVAQDRPAVKSSLAKIA
jgi:hypothetical protein